MDKRLNQTPAGEAVSVITFSSAKEMKQKKYVSYIEAAQKLNTNPRVIYRFRERGVLPFLYAKIATAKPITVMEHKDFEFLKSIKGRPRMKLVELAEKTTDTQVKTKIKKYLDPFRPPSKRFKTP